VLRTPQTGHHLAAGVSGSSRDYSSLPWLVVWLAGVMTITLFPWDFGARRNPVFQFEWHRLIDVKNLVLNVLLFVPLGAVLQREAERRSTRLSTGMLLGAAVGVLITSTIEVLQGFLPQRESSLVDVAANVAGALLGVLSYRAWASVAARPSRLEVQASPRLLTGVVIIFTCLALLASAGLQRRTNLGTWNEHYPLLVGNEDTGERPWLGRIYAFELTDGATSPERMRRFSSGEPVSMSGIRLAKFDFAGAAPYEDAAANIPALEWAIDPAAADATTGVRLIGRSWLRTDGPASRLADRIRQTNVFSLRVRCATDDLGQAGPARIISNSADTARRNFTLGQRGNALVFRLRTPHTGLNGYRPEAVMPGVFVNTRPLDILASYDGATLSVAVAGSHHVDRTRLTPGSSLWTAVTSLNLEDDALRVFDLGYVAVVFMLGGLLIGLSARTLRHRLALGYLWVVTVALLLESTSVLASGRFFDWPYAAGNACVGIVILSAMSIVGWGRGFTPHPVLPAGSRRHSALEQRA
jgi:glycopeptide antibiotics resistance protein